YASDFYIIPTVPDFLSRIGVHILTAKITGLMTGAFPSTGLRLLGITTNLGKQNIRANRQSIELLKRDLDIHKRERRIDERAVVFSTWIPELVGVKEASEANIPLCVLSGGNYNAPKDLYKNLTTEILAHLATY
ncbi:regulatory protein, partial [Candidatus Magnetobacterium bavaricum]